MRKVLFITEEFDAVYDAIEEYFERGPTAASFGTYNKQAHWYVDDIQVDITTRVHAMMGIKVNSIFLDKKFLNNTRLYGLAADCAEKIPKETETALKVLETVHYNKLKEMI